MPDEPEAFGLLALMLLQDSRRDARLSADGELVLLADQDRGLWDTRAIDEGLRMLARAEALRRPGPYQLQAAIAAGHAQGSDPATLVAAYEALLRLDGSPVARLNHAVAVALAGDVERGLSLVEAIPGLDGYRHYHSARADLLRRLGRADEARDAYLRALELTDDGPERRFLERRLGETAARRATMTACASPPRSTTPSGRRSSSRPPRRSRSRASASRRRSRFRTSSSRTSSPTCATAASSRASEAPRAATASPARPDEITVADVIRVVEGPIASVRGERPDEIVYEGAAVPLRDVWIELRTAMRGVLEQTTLADLVERGRGAGAQPP